ncbi:MAG TPA: TadG family pilus assembly protein [Sphingomonas sp.]
MRARSSLLASTSGNVTILFSGGLLAFLGVAALAVDATNLYLAKRHAQGIADSAALAAAGDIQNASSAAAAARNANPMQGLSILSVEPGQYADDPTIAAGERFVAGPDNANAARVRVHVDAPLYFARIFGKPTVPVEASGTAARIDLVAFSIGSRLAGVNGGLPNAMLSQLAGTDLQLSAMDYQALASGQLDILKFSEALRSQLNVQTATFGELMNTQASLGQIARAMSASVTDAQASSVLRAVADRLPQTSTKLSSLIDLGPLAGETKSDPSRPITVDAFSMLRGTLELGGQHQISTDLAATVPGLTSTKLTIAIGERAANSPWLRVTAAHDVEVRTAQTRIYLDTQVAPQLGLASLRVPIYVELAAATAKLKDVSCTGGSKKATVKLNVTPSVGEAAIADVDPAALGNFQVAPALNRVTMLRTPVATVSGFADVKLGGVDPQEVFFSASDIASHSVKHVSTNDLVQGVVSSLISRIDLNVNVLGLGLGVGALTALVGQVLGQAAAPLDGVYSQVTSLLGVQVGQADVWVNGVRCGTPVLVG